MVPTTRRRCRAQDIGAGSVPPPQYLISPKQIGSYTVPVCTAAIPVRLIASFQNTMTAQTSDKLYSCAYDGYCTIEDLCTTEHLLIEEATFRFSSKNSHTNARLIYAKNKPQTYRAPLVSIALYCTNNIHSVPQILAGYVTSPTANSSTIQIFVGLNSFVAPHIIRPVNTINAPDTTCALHTATILQRARPTPPLAINFYHTQYCTVIPRQYSAVFSCPHSGLTRTA